MLLGTPDPFLRTLLGRGASGASAVQTACSRGWRGEEGHSNGLCLQTPEPLTDQLQNRSCSGKKGCPPTRPGGKGGV